MPLDVGFASVGFAMRAFEAGGEDWETGVEESEGLGAVLEGGNGAADDGFLIGRGNVAT